MQPYYSKHHTLVAKGVGCLLLLLYHLFYAPSFSAAHGVSTFFLSLEQLAKYTAIGNVCVTLFILLSGYGIAASLQNTISPRGIFTRLLLRIIRLYGAFWFVYILFAPWQTVFDNWNYSHFGYAVIDFFGLAHFFGEQTINGAWWYLAVLLLCYILTPIFLLFLRRAPIFLTSVIIFLAVIAKNYDLILISTYAVGMLLHRFELLDRMVRWTENAKAWQACLSAIFFLLSAGLLAFARQQTVFYTILSLAILFACLVMEKCAKCVCNLLAVYGVHSANIYFFHVFLYEKNFPNLVYAPKTPLLIFPVFAISCFLISLLIEWIKKGIRLNTFLSWCCNKAVELTAGKEKNVF